jgi:serpin B
MARVLHLDPSDKAGVSLGGFLMALNDAGRTGGFELAVANALWGAKGYPFRPDYLAMVDKNFHGHLAELNFEVNPEGARKTINDWVAAQTHDRIKNLLPSGTIDPGTRLVLTNAIYFKGKWDLPFEARRTREDDFTSADGSKSKAAFMFQNAHFRYAEDDQVQVLELPYGKDALAMRIYLPKETDGLASFEKQMTAQKLADLGARLTSQDVDVWLPRFTMESEFSLADALKAMGMHAAFVPQQADFKGMTTAEQLYISAVIHKAFVKVDEEGTEAAAATAVVMRPMGVLRKPQPRQFRANHPFVFEIVDQKSAATLFMGRLATAPAGK